jgi:predicted 3-demethylubiquinone-9 3-methyltransferase (glyoxalase superfamily)
VQRIFSRSSGGTYRTAAHDAAVVQGRRPNVSTMRAKKGGSMDKIATCLWFDGQAEEAAKFYVSVFSNARIVDVMYYNEAVPSQAGRVLTVTFEIEGREFIGLNGGPHFTFTPAISLFVKCETQAEVDTLWNRLLEGGAPQQCGWLTDRFGISWQIVPTVLGKMLQDKDRAKSKRVMEAMLSMVKLDIAALENAYAGQ